MKKVKYQMFWMVYYRDGYPSVWTARINAWRAKAQAERDTNETWDKLYRQGYRCKKVGVIK